MKQMQFTALKKINTLIIPLILHLVFYLIYIYVARQMQITEKTDNAYYFIWINNLVTNGGKVLLIIAPFFIPLICNAAYGAITFRNQISTIYPAILLFLLICCVAPLAVYLAVSGHALFRIERWLPGVFVSCLIGFVIGRYSRKFFSMHFNGV